ncbi:triadin isoform X1 [Sigmodon hispidus]
MTEITAEGNASTTTTVIDNKNGSVPKSPGKVLKRTVTEDIVTTFSSPAAWLLVIALIVTWSAVAIVMFDLVDYKNFSASSIAKIGSDPLKFVNDAVEETTDWIYGFFSLLSDIISSEGDEEDEDVEEDIDKGEIEEPPLKRKEIDKEKAEKQEKPEKKTLTKVPHREKEKEKEKRKEGEKPEKKGYYHSQLQLKKSTETNLLFSEDKKVKAKEKTEEKTKKEVKVGKQEEGKSRAAKVKETLKPPPKARKRDDKETTAVPEREQKDQYAFCRYMIDMFVHGDLKPGQSPALPPPPSLRAPASRPALPTPVPEEKEEETIKSEKKVPSETKKKEKGEAKKKSEKETAIDIKSKGQGKYPEAKETTAKALAQAAAKRNEKKEDSKKTKKTPEEQPKGKKQEKKEKPIEPAKSSKKEQPAPSEKHGKTKYRLVKMYSSLTATEAVSTTTVHGKKDEKAKTVEQGKDAKPKPPQPQVKKEEKSDADEHQLRLCSIIDEDAIHYLQVKKETKPVPVDKAQIHKKDNSKSEQVVPHGKPEQKVLKHIKAITAEKTGNGGSRKCYKPKPSSIQVKGERTSEVPDSGKKKIEKSEKEIKVPTRQENLQVHNVTKAEKPSKIPKDSKDASSSKKDIEDSKDVPVSKKDKEVTDDVSSPKKQKNPISFFQCVYLDGYNGYGFQFPVTPAQRPGENPGKANSPGQKQQGQ